MSTGFPPVSLVILHKGKGGKGGEAPGKGRENGGFKRLQKGYKEIRCARLPIFVKKANKAEKAANGAGFSALPEGK